MRNLKLSALIAAIAIVTAISFVSCSKDENEPIALHDVENNSIDMVFYPDANKQSISIIGGGMAITLRHVIIMPFLKLNLFKRKI